MGICYYVEWIYGVKADPAPHHRTVTTRTTVKTHSCENGHAMINGYKGTFCSQCGSKLSFKTETRKKKAKVKLGIDERYPMPEEIPEEFLIEWDKDLAYYGVVFYSIEPRYNVGPFKVPEIPEHLKRVADERLSLLGIKREPKIFTMITAR